MNNTPNKTLAIVENTKTQFEALKVQYGLKSSDELLQALMETIEQPTAKKQFTKIANRVCENRAMQQEENKLRRKCEDLGITIEQLREMQDKKQETKK